jgi:D-alanyl-D-alanine-carboxypeptidase/D-alanyl-D-alanine-endopeptidase
MERAVVEEITQGSQLAKELLPMAGAVVAVVDADRVEVVALGVGVGAQTPMQVGSVTKGFTGLLLAQAVERAEIGLDSRIDEVLFGERWAGQEAISALLLATHRSGLARVELPLMQRINKDPYRDYGREDLLRSVKENAPRVPREPAYAYSNFGFAVLGLMLEKAAGQTYAALLEERLFVPLGMRATHVQLADGREWVQPGFSATGEPRPVWHFDAYAPCGAMVSTVDDLVTAVRAFLDPDSFVAQAVQNAVQPRADVPGGSVGLAWHAPADGAWFWHNGATFGHVSYFGVSRRSGSGVVIVANQFLPTAVTDLGRSLMRQLAQAE